MADDDKPAPRRAWWRGVLRWLAEFGVYLVIAVVVVSLVRIFLVQPFTVPSGSMQETLLVGDSIVAWKPSPPKRGEVVVFRDDLHWLGPAPVAPTWKRVLSWVWVLPPQDEQYLVKRLIGLPGDHVTCCDASGRISVNGVPLDETTYLYYSNTATAHRSFDIVVPAGHIFVMGDHRDASADSRYHMCNGATPTPELTFPSIDAIQGRAFAILRPFIRTQTLAIPDAFAGVPPPASPAPDPGATASWTCA